MESSKQHVKDMESSKQHIKDIILSSQYMNYDKTELLSLLMHLNTQYHRGKEEITDQQYDLLFEYYKNKFDQDIDSVDSHYQQSTYEQQSLSFCEVQLPIPMNSLKKLYIKENTQQEYGKIINFIQNHAQNNQLVHISVKLDGVSLLIQLKNGQYNFYTKGNGQIGRNINDFCKYIHGDKLQLIQNKMNQILCEQKGSEIYFRCELLVKQQIYQQKYQDKYKNARQLSSLINKKYINDKNDELAIADLDIIPFYIQIDDKVIDLYDKNILGDSDLIFYRQINLQDEQNNCIQQILDFHKQIQEQNTYQFDGLVIDCGNNNKIAIKFQQEQINTSVQQIVWNISGKGKIIPVIYINPVEINGTTIKKVSGFNYQYIIDNQIGIGSEIAVEKSGGVIPNISHVIQPGGNIPMPEFDYQQVGKDIFVVDQNISDVIINKLEKILKNYSIKGIGKKKIQMIYQAYEQNMQDMNVVQKLNYLLMISEQDIAQKQIPGIQSKFKQIYIQSIREVRNQAKQKIYLYIHGLSLTNNIMNADLLQGFMPDLQSFLQKDFSQLNMKGFGQSKIQNLVELQNLVRQHQEDITKFA